MNSDFYPHLLVSIPQSSVNGFASLLQHGVFIPLDKEMPLISFLLGQLGFSRKYLETAIQTIFVNGVAADRFDVILRDGSILALSAAMPGLAGAIFRRQGIHNVLRSQPAVHPTAMCESTGFVTVKMFNSIATDQIEKLLAQGILVKGAAFNAFTEGRDYLFQPPATFSFMKKNVEYSQLPAMIAQYQIVKIQIHPIDGI